MTAATGENAPAARLPRSYLVWLGGAVVSQCGDAALYFALGWAASAHGGPATGLVLSTVSLPRTVLLLLGGAVGDRLGARRIMIVGDGVMLAVAAVLAAASWRWGTPLALLVTAGLVIGTVDAFYLPSSGSMPRQLVDDACLPRALALRQSGSQLVSMVGGPAGGALVALAGLTAASAADSASFAVVLAALIAIRPRFTPPDTPRRSVLHESADGIRMAIQTPGLVALLLLVAGVAGFVIPATSLLVPLITRQHHWTAAVAGLIVGAQAAGGMVMALAVARRGTAARPGLAAALGLVAIAVGELMIGLAPVKALALAGAVAMGMGTGMFTCNLAPALMGTAPRSHLARIQALLSLAQSGVLLAFNNVLGAVAHAASPAAAMITCASAVSACALAALLVPAIRHARSPQPR
ncbi:MAG: putative arabinose efflux permease, family [Actinomycetia bacterium]|nr:putative arabinose efflux permease, family [Actinomycetes bacterium]